MTLDEYRAELAALNERFLNDGTCTKHTALEIIAMGDNERENWAWVFSHPESQNIRDLGWLEPFGLGDRKLVTVWGFDDNDNETVLCIVELDYPFYGQEVY